jgi:hypothetical protein
MLTTGAALGTTRVQLLLGLDSAPYLTYGAQPKDREYLFAALLGAQLALPTQIGVFASAGASVQGVGARVAWTGLRDFRDHPMGLEVRAEWLPPRVGALGSLCWVWTL